MSPVQQVFSTRGVGEYLASESHILWYHRLDPLTANTKIGLIMAHGAGNTASEFMTTATPAGIVAPTAVSANRMPAIATDMGGTSTWGNSTAMTAMDATKTFFSNRAGANNQVILVGISMGATTVLNWARTHLAQVAAIALFIPVVDLQDIIDNNRSGLGPLVTAAYGGSNPPAASNPAVNTADFVGKPIRIWYSSNDPICIPSLVTAFGTATGATMTNLGAVGHATTGMDVDNVATWLAQYI